MSGGTDAAPLLTIPHSLATAEKSTCGGWCHHHTLTLWQQRRSYLAVVCMANATDQELELLFVIAARHCEVRSANELVDRGSSRWKGSVDAGSA